MSDRRKIRNGVVVFDHPTIFPEGVEVEVRVVGQDNGNPLNRHIDLSQRGVSQAQAADLRNRLDTFAEDWNRPEMDAYDAL